VSSRRQAKNNFILIFQIFILKP